MAWLYGLVLVVVVTACYLWYRRRMSSGMALAKEFEKANRVPPTLVNPIEDVLRRRATDAELLNDDGTPGRHKLSAVQAQAASDIRSVCKLASPSVVLRHRRGVAFTVTRVVDSFVIVRDKYTVYPPTLRRYVCGRRPQDGIFFADEPRADCRADNASTEGMRLLAPDSYEFLLQELRESYKTE
jgi:hypothetical protein